MRAQDINRADLCHTLTANNQSYNYYSLSQALKDQLALEQLPYSTRARLEQLLHSDNTGDNLAIALNSLQTGQPQTISFQPERLITQISSDLPAFLTLARLRDKTRYDSHQLQPALPVDLVLDHSPLYSRPTPEAQQVTRFAHWCQQAFKKTRLSLPGVEGSLPAEQQRSDIIVHRTATDSAAWLQGECCASSSSHSSLSGALGIAEWRISALEAEGLLLGHPLSIQLPDVVGIILHGQLPVDCEAEDLAQATARILNSSGLNHCSYEYGGSGLSQLSLGVRLRITQATRQLGITSGYFPIDEQTLRGLTHTGHSPRLRTLIESWASAQYLLRSNTEPEPQFHRFFHLDMDQLRPDPMRISHQRNTRRPTWIAPRHPTGQRWPWDDTPALQPAEIENPPETSLEDMRILARLDEALYTEQLPRFYENALNIADRAIATVIFGNHGYGSTHHAQTARTLNSLGVRAVICQSFAPYERRDLVCMGIYPLTFVDGDSWQAMNLSGQEFITLEIPNDALPLETVMMTIQRQNNRRELVELTLGLETDEEIALCQAGGMLNMTTRQKPREGRSIF